MATSIAAQSIVSLFFQASTPNAFPPPPQVPDRHRHRVSARVPEPAQVGVVLRTGLGCLGVCAHWSSSVGAAKSSRAVPQLLTPTPPPPALCRSEIVPATLKKSTRPLERDTRGPRRDGPPRRFGDREGYRSEKVGAAAAAAAGSVAVCLGKLHRLRETCGAPAAWVCWLIEPALKPAPRRRQPRLPPPLLVPGWRCPWRVPPGVPRRLWPRCRAPVGARCASPSLPLAWRGRRCPHSARLRLPWVLRRAAAARAALLPRVPASVLSRRSGACSLLTTALS